MGNLFVLAVLMRLKYRFCNHKYLFQCPGHL